MLLLRARFANESSTEPVAEKGYWGADASVVCEIWQLGPEENPTKKGGDSLESLNICISTKTFSDLRRGLVLESDGRTVCILSRFSAYAWYVSGLILLLTWVGWGRVSTLSNTTMRVSNL